MAIKGASILICFYYLFLNSGFDNSLPLFDMMMNVFHLPTHFFNDSSTDYMQLNNDYVNDSIANENFTQYMEYSINFEEWFIFTVTYDDVKDLYNSGLSQSEEILEPSDI